MLYIPGLGYIPLANFPGLGGAAGGRGPAAPPPQPEGEREWTALQVRCSEPLLRLCRSLWCLAMPLPLHAVGCAIFNGYRYGGCAGDAGGDAGGAAERAQRAA